MKFKMRLIAWDKVLLQCPKIVLNNCLKLVFEFRNLKNSSAIHKNQLGKVPSHDFFDVLRNIQEIFLCINYKSKKMSLKSCVITYAVRSSFKLI